MKKALSIILCLAMLLTTFPMSVFAAPSVVTTGETALESVFPEIAEEAQEKEQEQEEDSNDAELTYGVVVYPVCVKPANGETVDRRYPVAYYTFDDGVVIDEDTVTLENVGNEAVGGVYFDKETNTIWVFPAKPETTVYKNNKVEYTAWTSNIATEDGSLLYFPGVSFNLETSIPSDGKNILPFGNMEYGWTPFDLEGFEDYFAVVEDPANPDNHVTERTWKKGTSKWPHSRADVAWKPGATYKLEARVMVKDFVNDSGIGGNSASSSITPDPIYTVPSFSCVGKPVHPDQTGTVCTVCGKAVDREHMASFSDHPSQADAASVSITSGVNNGWQTISYEITVRDNADITMLRAFSIYSNPGSNYATEYYIDDVSVYEKVTVSFAAGINSAKKTARDQTAKKGYNGDVVELPDPNTRYQSTKDGYVLDGWTDGKKVYAVGEEYVIDGAATLTPNVVPDGESYQVIFSVDEQFASSYTGPGVLSVATGDTLDITTEEFKLGSAVGYRALGWKNAKTGEFVTSVSGAAGEKIELVAVYELKTGIVVDTAAKAAELSAVPSAGVFDETVPGFTVIPANGDPRVYFESLAINTDEYDFVDVTYVNNSMLAAENAGELFYIVTGISNAMAGYSTTATKLSENGNLVTYRYNLDSKHNWTGMCSAIRIDPYNSTERFTITEIKFVKNEVVDEIEISGLEEPILGETPDFSVNVPSDAAYTVTNVSWTPDNSFFASETQYTVKIGLTINKSGYMFDELTSATINGDSASITTSPLNNKYAEITKTYDKTEAAKKLDIKLTSDNKITENDGTLELEASVAAVDGTSVLPDTVVWAITGGDEGIATLEGNVLTAKWDGVVEVTATPDYDAAQAKAFDITISGQVGFNVYYDQNTGADVENLPEKDRAKKEYKVSSLIPTRAGFTFEGWMLDPEAEETVTDLRVTGDVTLYAKWAKGSYIADFNNKGDAISSSDAYKVALADGNFFGTNGARDAESAELDVENSQFVIKLNGGNDFYMTLTSGSAKAINLDNVRAVEYGFRTDAVGSIYGRLYFATKDENGIWIAPDYSTDGAAYVENGITQNYVLDGNVDTLHKFRIDTTVRSAFSGYLNHIRFDIENSDSFGGKTIYLDYVKLVGEDSVENIDLDITAPKASTEVYGLEAVTANSAKYEVKDIIWEGPELVDGKYYAGASEYTAKITLEASEGYALSDAPLTVAVNGEDAEITLNGNVATVTYTFPATEKLADIELLVKVADNAPAEITEAYGTLQLENRIYYDSSLGIVPTSDVYWSIDESQKKYASVDKNGLVTANTDCNALVVTATSKYNPQIKASISIKITGQIPESNIYFASGTGETVENLPAATTAKGEYILPMDVIPTRTGYAFKGWSKTIGGEIIRVDDVHEDTTYYAVWGYMKSEEFDGTTYVFMEYGVSNVTLSDGILSGEPTNSNPVEGIMLQAGNGIFGSSSRIKTDDIEYLEIKTNIAPENLELCVYVRSGSNTGTALTAWNEAANTRFYSNKNEISRNPAQNIFDYVEKNGDWYIYKLPVGLLKYWNNYLHQIRFNFVQRDMENATYSYTAYPAGFVAKFDYVRFIGRDIPVMEINGVSVPEVKGEASEAKDAIVVQDEAFKVTDITWTPELLGGIFFGSGETYTAEIDVEILGGYNSFSNPPAIVKVNGKDAEYKRVSATKATITYTFPATEDVGELAIVNVNLHEINETGDTVTNTRQIFSGDDFDLDKFSASNNPVGKRWVGWSETEGGENISGTINITKDTDFYAIYEDVLGYDFSNKYHKNEKNVTATGGTVSFDGPWAVVTPDANDSAAKLTLDGMNVASADYDFVEVIYDGSLEDANNKNRFSEKTTPVLRVIGADGTLKAAQITRAQVCVTNNRVSYKYTYDLTINGKPDRITGFELAPYTGKPAWAVTKVMLVPNAPIEEAVALTGIKAPEAWAMPDVSAEVNDKYEIVSVNWTPVEGAFNANGSFAAETAYTVAVEVKPAIGNKIVVDEATVDGEAADSAVIQTNGNIIITKTYPATEALVDFTLEIADAIIDVADGTVQLVPVFTPSVAGTTIENTEVKWEIVSNGPDGRSATIDENGVVKAVFDGEVVVKAISDYNPLVSALATVTITNQIASYEVKFDKNTKSEVTGMPETTYVKGVYVLPKTVPVRTGFTFAGWVKSPDDKVSISKDNITKDTTYYALWVRGGVHYEFFNENENSDLSISIGNVKYSKVDAENGVLTFQPRISGYNSLDSMINIQKRDNSPLFKGSDYPKIVVRMTSTMSSEARHKVYFTSDLVSSYSEANAVTTKAVVGPDGYTDIVFDMTSKSGWTDGNITAIRFDPIDSGADMSHLNAVMSIDYIRAVDYEANVIEVSGIDTPVVKAVADTDAVSNDESKYVVTNVSWEGGLLYGYYFGGETEYTACVTVKGVTGFAVSDVPQKATINGIEVNNFSYNSNTGELTIKHTFPATGVLENAKAHDVILNGKTDLGENDPDPRTIFDGDTFNIGKVVPKSIPTGKRWIGWSTKDGSKQSDVPETVVVTGPVTYYAVYEDLVEFNYSNYYHTLGTTAKFAELVFEDGLAVVKPVGSDSDANLITPVMNIAGKDFDIVEVYYSNSMSSVHNNVTHDNRFSGALSPVLKFSRVETPNSFKDDASNAVNAGTLVKFESVMIDGVAYSKYVYDMTTSPHWRGNIACLSVDPYNGYPNWGVGLIKLVRNVGLQKPAAIELPVPEAKNAPSTVSNVSINEGYVVTGVKWTPEQNVFDAEKEYSVEVTFKASAGYYVTNLDVTINGSAADDIVTNEDGTYTARKAFAKTNALKPVSVFISGKNEIVTKGRYLDLVGKTVADDGSELPTSDVTWEIRNADPALEGDIAVVVDGRVYPGNPSGKSNAISNGDVIVTARSVYDPTKTATHMITISNQTQPLPIVTFDKNTLDDVEGIPDPIYVYGKFEPKLTDSIKRDGFFFLGWSVDEDALEPDESFNITEDTTLYAKWGAGVEWSFGDSTSALSATPVGRDVTYSNGIATYGPNTDPKSSGQIILEKDSLSSLGLETANHSVLEIKISLPVASQVKYYLQSAESGGANKSVWTEAANTNSISQKLYDANEPGTFQTISYDLKEHECWNTYPYVNRIRLDLPQAGPSAGAQIDYIRLLSQVRTVKFDGNEGLIPYKGGKVTSFKETYGTGEITLPEKPVREAYSFLGWAKAKDNYSKIYNNKFVVTDSVTLYAIWAPAAVLNTETVTAAGGQITVNENGSVTVNSTQVTAPVIDVDDNMPVGDNKTITIKVNAKYTSTQNGDVTLHFTDKNGDPQQVVLKTGGLNGEETITVDLSDKGFEDTVTDVKVAFPEGVIENLTVETIAFTTKELSAVYTENESIVIDPKPTVSTVVGGKPTPAPGVIVFPSLGGGSVSEHGASVTQTPDKKVDKVTRPADDSEAGTQSGTTNTTPSTPSKFPITETYDGRFTDVSSSNWYYSDVEKSYKLGLMKGKSDDTFVPDGTVSLAEAITVAARMNAIYNSQTIAEGTGNSWYQPYVDYAVKKAIVTSGQYSDYTALATREQVALMFVRALPSSWYTQKNLFLTIPDVPASSSSFAAIQRLYNAGVIIGVDDKYNFKPNDNIKRSELSAIINRVALVDSRLRVVTEDEKNSNIKIFDTNAILKNLTIGNCVEKVWTEKNGGAYAVPAKADPVVNGLQNLLGGTVDADTYKKVTVVIRSESKDVGGQAQMFFWSDTVQLSEANSVRASLPKADAEGNISIVFDMKSNAAWKGEMTNLRFDPFNAMFDFAIVSIKFE